MMQIGRHEGALQGCAVGLQEVGRAVRPIWQLHIAHQLPALALAQRQVIKVHQEAASSTRSMKLAECRYMLQTASSSSSAMSF